MNLKSGCFDNSQGIKWLNRSGNSIDIAFEHGPFIEGSLEVKPPIIWTVGKSQRREEKKKEDQRRERGRRQKMQVREKVGKSRNIVFFQWFVGRRWSKSRLAKAAGAEPPGQMRDEELHAVVVQSTFRCQNVQRTPGSVHFRKLTCRKSAPCCGAKHISKSKVLKTEGLRPLLEVGKLRWSVEKVRAVHIEVRSVKIRRVRSAFGRSDVVLRGRCKGFCTLSGVRRRSGFCGISKIDGRRGTGGKDLERCFLRGRRSIRDMFIRDVRKSRGCILKYQIFRFAKMNVRDRCSTMYDLASLFRGTHSTLDRWSGKIAKRIGTRPSALHPTVHSWRKSRSVASFLLSKSKVEAVSQTCFGPAVGSLSHPWFHNN